MHQARTNNKSKSKKKQRPAASGAAADSSSLGSSSRGEVQQAQQAASNTSVVNVTGSSSGQPQQDLQYAQAEAAVDALLKSHAEGSRPSSKDSSGAAGSDDHELGERTQSPNCCCPGMQ